MKKIRLLLLSTTLLIAAGLSLIYLHHSKGHEKPSYNIKEEQLYLVYGVSFPEQMLWIASDQLLIKQERELLILDSSTRTLTTYDYIDLNSSIGFSDETIYICEYENYLINVPDQTATKIEIYSYPDKYLKTVELHDTVRPLNCDKSTLQLIDNYHGSPGRLYTLDLASSKLEQLSHFESEFNISGTSQIIITDHNQSPIFQIDLYNSIEQFEVNREKSRIALLSRSGELWIYISSP